MPEERRPRARPCIDRQMTVSRAPVLLNRSIGMHRFEPESPALLFERDPGKALPQGPIFRPRAQVRARDQFKRFALDEAEAVTVGETEPVRVVLVLYATAYRSRTAEPPAIAQVASRHRLNEPMAFVARQVADRQCRIKPGWLRHRLKGHADVYPATLGNARAVREVAAHAERLNRRLRRQWRRSGGRAVGGYIRRLAPGNASYENEAPREKQIPTPHRARIPQARLRSATTEQPPPAIAAPRRRLFRGRRHGF